MPSGTDTIPYHEAYRLTAGCNSTYVVGIKSHCRARTRSLHDWLQLHRLPMLRTSCSHENSLSGRQYIHDNFQNGAIKQDHTEIAALAMIIRAAPT
jgi:hypothetical protein